MSTSVITNQGAGQAMHWLVAKENYEAAKQKLDRARRALLANTPSISPLVVVNTPLGRVAVQEKARRDFDVDKLLQLVGFNTAEKVTALKVEHEAFDSAVTEGLISAKTVAKVTIPTPYIAVSKHEVNL